jgi:hypothetical protein
MVVFNLFYVYAEVDPNFMLKYWKELSNKWRVLDKYGTRNLLEFNNNFCHPLIIGGWNRLQQFVGFENNVDVLFGYYGYKCFSIKSFNEIKDSE